MILPEKGGENWLKFGIVSPARSLFACLLLNLFQRITNMSLNLAQLATISKDKIFLQESLLSDHVIDRVYCQ